jgi:hypothetical protein
VDKNNDDLLRPVVMKAFSSNGAQKSSFNCDHPMAFEQWLFGGHGSWPSFFPFAVKVYSILCLMVDLYIHKLL